LEDQTKELMGTGRIPYPSLTPSRPRDGTLRSSNSRITELKRSIMILLPDSQAISAELTLDLYLIMKRFFLKL